MSKETILIKGLMNSQSDMALLKIAHEALGTLSEKYQKEENLVDVNRTILHDANSLVEELHERAVLAKEIGIK